MNFANFVDLAARNAAMKPAVGDETELLTHAELSARTAAAADALASLGVEADDRVAVCLRNGVPFLTAHLGAMRLGAVPVPINTEFDARQIRYALDTSDVSVLVTDAAFADVAADVETAVTVDGSAGHDFRELLDDANGGFAVEPRRSDELAAVVYTSGTTGRPKGVRHTHGNLVANALGIVTYFDLTRDAVGLTACQCFHVTGLNVTTTPLLVAEAENRLLPSWDPEAALAAIEDHGVTCTFLTPGMLLDLVDHDAVDRYDTSALEIVCVGGAPMPTARIDDAEAALGCPVLEGYGMTETTPLAAFNRPGDARKPGSVGPPAREVVEVRVEDFETGREVDRGERGELTWRGDTVTPGYERSRHDREAFVERRGRRWLRSGDVGYLDDEGFLYVVDRREDMFTTGCGNVFPREIEDVLYDLDVVAGAAVIDARDDVRGAVVTAIVRPVDDLAPGDRDLAAERVREACEERLEAHEVPRRVEFVDEIPTTATGKVDRVALREAFGAANSR
ncbi:class I adenylate-forming enzyme family protein [Halomarina pelagica]|uniref:class I adenylate-forming enzyme family protein n=1 Tax=Halomarina pelagica TaxID=2961599 RepID=UPI0020C37EF3|nr:class I adenylate-forming enzyme family protein [Halomarina sp. BND7]